MILSSPGTTPTGWANDGLIPHGIHADRGTSMTSRKVAHLLADLGIDQTHSRPKVSNDGPFSEAQ